MSTFTRLYFTNRGPDIADSHSQGAPRVGESFVSPETIPLDADHDTARHRALTELAILPNPSKILRMLQSPPISRSRAEAEDDRDPPG